MIRARVAVVAIFLSAVGSFALGTVVAGGRAADGHDESPRLAEWKGGAVTANELQAWLETKSPMVRAEYREPQQRAVLCDELIDVELLAAEARQRHLQDAPKNRVRVDELMASALLSMELEQAGALSEEDLKAFFEQHRGDFERPEQRRARLIQLRAPESDGGMREQQRSRAEQLRASLETDMKADPYAFHRAARTTSDHLASKNVDGDLGMRAASDFEAIVGPEVSKSIGSLPPGGVSPVIETPAGFAIVYVEVVLPAASTPFEIVRNQLSDRAAADRKLRARRELTARLRERAAVRIDGAQLNSFEPGS